MAGIDRKHQPVEEAPALRGGASKQLIHRGHQPDHPQMVGERRCRSRRLAVDAVFADRRRVGVRRRLDAGTERREAERAVDLGRDRPGAVALIESELAHVGAAQPAARREQRDRFEEVRLAGAVRPDQHDEIAANCDIRRVVAAEIGKRQSADAGFHHGAPSAPKGPIPAVEVG